MGDGDERDGSGADVVGTITRAVDPVLAPFGFASGQGGLHGGPVSLVPGEPLPRVDGQLIWCRAFPDGAPGCEDVVMNLVSDPWWHVSVVRDWDLPDGGWTHEYGDDTPLAVQLEQVVRDLRRRFDDEWDGGPSDRPQAEDRGVSSTGRISETR